MSNKKLAAFAARQWAKANAPLYQGNPEGFAAAVAKVQSALEVVGVIDHVKPLSGTTDEGAQAGVSDLLWGAQGFDGACKRLVPVRGQGGHQGSEQHASAPAAGLHGLNAVGAAAEDGLELAVRQAAQLIVKAVPTKGIADRSVFPCPADADHPVDGASPVPNGNAGVLSPFASLRPMVGVARYQGNDVLVVGPWFVSFDQLSLHGYLSEEEVQQLRAAAKKTGRDLYRVIRRRNKEAIGRTFSLSELAAAGRVS